MAVKIGVSERSVRRWRQEREQPKKKNERPPGKPAYLSEEQIKQLEQELLRGAYAHGYSEDYWTLDRIGWSCQKIRRLAIQRNNEMIANWNRRVWPRAKKVA